jgi:hypothetical protein
MPEGPTRAALQALGAAPMLIGACQRWAALSGGRLDLDDPAPPAPAPAPAALPQAPPPAAAAAGAAPSSAGAAGAPPDDGAGVGLRRGSSLAAASAAAAAGGILRRAATATGHTLFSALGTAAATAERGGADPAAAGREPGQGHLAAESWVQRRVRRPCARGERAGPGVDLAERSLCPRFGRWARPSSSAHRPRHERRELG